jgi:Fur family ferric uptake transcriptional regulator
MSPTSASHRDDVTPDPFTRFTDLLRARGYRLTAARRHIVRALVDCGGHVTADDLAEAVHASEPGIGRMTVYRTLDLLHELGLIQPVYQGTGAAHYVLMHQGHHHHFVCSACERVVEIDDCALQDFEAALGERYGFAVQGHLLELYGLCARCRD